MKKLIIFLIIAYLSFTINSGASTQEKDSKNKNILKIGVLLPLSGHFQDIGESFLKAVQLALYDISNENIKIYPKDSKGNSLGAYESAKEFDKEGIKIVIGPIFFESLERLPGVGHKTASVVMSQGFGCPAFPVDTHIHRLAQRWRLTNGKNVKQTEKDLKRLFNKEDWNKLHLQIIMYGREYCSARDCFGLTCSICSKINKERKRPIKTKKA